MGRYNVIFAGPETALRPHAREAVATEAITPGSILTLGASGFALATAATTGKVYIAQDNYLTMKGVDDDWAVDETVIALNLLDGQLFNARLANGQTVTVDTPLTPGAGGELVVAGTSDFVVATAEETYTNASGSAQLVRVKPAIGYLTAAA